MKKKILVIGNGGRENMICQALARSPQEIEIYNFGTAVNPDIKKVATDIMLGDILDLEQIKKSAEKFQPDFAIVGPDDPIGIGATDALAEIGVKSFSSSKKCAQLEGSKSFTRNLLAKYDIDASPDFYVSTDATDSSARNAFYEKFRGKIVVKADGLLGGKGVIVADDHFTTWEEAEEFALKSIEKFGRVVLEEKLIGEEFSLIFLADGEAILPTPAIQDHKRAFNGDTGPNTGGMGTISDERHSLPFLDNSDLEKAAEITHATMKAVEKETGEKFVGCMYGGFIKTRNGIKLIEYNARFGDPEAFNILAILENDFVDVCEKAIAGKLSAVGKLKFTPVATVLKYLCPEGYPTKSVKNVPIEIDPAAYEMDKNSAEFFLSSIGEEDGKYLLKGSRAIGILGKGRDLAEANANAEKMIQYFSGPLFYRTDIGTAEYMNQKYGAFAEWMKGA